MQIFIIALAVIFILIVLWAVVVQRRLVSLDEDVNQAMSQIGVQLSSRFDALVNLLNLTETYALCESEALLDSIQFERCMITAKSSPQEVLIQNRIITVSLRTIARLAERYPALKADAEYEKRLNAVATFETVIRTGCLVYNDTVAILNRTIRLFPDSVIAGLLGFCPREYWTEKQTSLAQ